MSVQRLFHVIHIVDDLAAAEKFYGTAFPLERFSARHYSDTDKRWASLWLIGDNFVIELMEPSHDPDDRQASIPKFHERFGQHLHSLAWYCDDVPELAQRLRADGIRVIDGGYGTIFTHPKDTFGQLQFQTGPPEVPVPDPRFDADWARSRESVRHPMTLLRASHITTLVSDLDRAQSLYESSFGARTLFEGTDSIARRAFMFIGTETIVELAEPSDTDSPLTRDLRENGQLPHSFSFLVADLSAAAAHLKSVGVAVQDVGPASLRVDPAATLGAVIELTDVPIPGDPR